MLALTLTSLLVVACDDGNRGDDPIGAAPAPDDYSSYIVFIGDGTWDPADPSFTAPTMAEIQRELWNFSDAEIEQYEVEAKAFFAARFGIDIDDPANAERITFTSYAADPRMRYRIVTMANRVVPQEGWPVSDAAFLLIVADPAGFELGGEFAGFTVPAGTTMTYGRYHIDTGDGEPLLIDFQSLSPYALDAFGVGAIRCELFSDELGTGEANAAYRLIQKPDGNLELTASNVLTFK
jgi:hypothetical protein